MALTDSSFMQIDNLISSNVKVGRLLANVPSGAKGSAIDMTHKNGIGLVLGNANVIITSSETDSHILMKTSEPSLKFDLGSTGTYTIASNASRDAFEHSTSFSGHEFVTQGKRIRMATTGDGVSVSSLDANGPCPLVLEGSVVDIPVTKVSVSNVLLVDNGLVSLRGKLSVSNVFTVDPTLTSTMSVIGDTSISGRLTANQLYINRDIIADSSQLTTLHVANTANVHNAYIGTSCHVGYAHGDPKRPESLAVKGDAFVTNNVDVVGTINASNLQTSSLNVSGPAVISKGLTLGGNLLTTSIGSPDTNLSLNANVLYFNTNHVMFKGNSYVVNTSSTTYTDKVIRLGDSTNSMYNNALRDGSGIVLVGAPDNKPANLNGNIHMRWLAAGGLFDSQGNHVPADARSRWEVAGGNFAIKSIDEQNSYMFSIDNGVLNLYKCANDRNGAQVNSQLVAAFGRNAVV